MKLQNLIDVLKFEEGLIVPLKIFQPAVAEGDEPEHLIEFLIDEYPSVKDELLDAEIENIIIGKSTGGSVSKPLYNIEFIVLLKDRIIEKEIISV